MTINKGVFVLSQLLLQRFVTCGFDKNAFNKNPFTCEMFFNFHGENGQ